MKKPVVVFRKQKSIAAILLSAAILIAGAILILESGNDEAVPVMAGQQESAPNRTITDLIGRALD
ncbi:MAG TPA: hypothetical protein PLD48_00820 [Bacillota bacterium]|nr:hypothetical protein [Bacillota bacterium]HOK68367.1 hypothetical protein [Bacillota bacterium]HPP85517.1 hypothetical protein [Bacillota bacterium]